ncbi:hypothetical protein BC940DRAFT_289925 [Gongronella butleri]|nr:hypothetical protein BC940DRAFT_289925 [Gongronella butleri]
MRHFVSALTCFFLYVSTVAAAATSCTAPPDKSCAFYTDCLEPNYHCGPKGYPLGFGYKFCTAFQNASASFSAKGQQFLWETMHCLEQDLVAPFINNATALAEGQQACADIESYAFSTHPHCYINSGFCSLSIDDKLALIKVILKGNISGILGSFFKQALDTLDGCIKEIIHI